MLLYTVQRTARVNVTIRNKPTAQAKNYTKHVRLL